MFSSGNLIADSEMALGQLLPDSRAESKQCSHMHMCLMRTRARELGYYYYIMTLSDKVYWISCDISRPGQVIISSNIDTPEGVLLSS